MGVISIFKVKYMADGFFLLLKEFVKMAFVGIAPNWSPVDKM